MPAAAPALKLAYRLLHLLDADSVHLAAAQHLANGGDLRGQLTAAVMRACRLLDLHDAGSVSLVAVSIVVLDECDKMLSVGFAPQLRRLSDILLRPAMQTAAQTPVQLLEESRSASTVGKKRPRQADQLLVPGSASTPAGGCGPAARPQVRLRMRRQRGKETHVRL